VEPPFDFLIATTNQKQVAMTEEGKARRFDQGGARGKGNTIIFAAIKVKKM
jgi:hypothetical protein